jgi:hypothetical protein
MMKPPLTILSSKKPTLRDQATHDRMVAEAIAAAMTSVTPEDIAAAAARRQDWNRIGEQLGVPPVSDPQALADFVMRAHKLATGGENPYAY